MMNYIFILFLIIVTIFLFVDTKKVKIFSISGLIIIAALWRFDSWCYPNSLCIDEAEWLALAGRIDECSVPYRCYNGSTSGFLTVGFVSLINLLGLKLTFFNLRIFGFVVCIIPSTVFIYLGLKKWYNQQTAEMVIPWLAMFMVFGFYNREFLSYNTEYILTLIFAVIYYLYATWKAFNFERKHEPILIALLLGILPYFKLQAVPFVFAFYVIIAWQYWKAAKWMKLGAWNLVLVLPTIVFIGYFLYHDVLHDFFKMYIEANAYYVNNPIINYRYSDNEFIHRLRAFKGMHFTTFMPFYLGLLPIVFMNLKRNNKFHFRIVNRTSIWIFLWVCYATFAPGTGFGHYNVLLLVPIIFLLGSFYHNLEVGKLRVNRWVTVLGVGITSLIYLNRAEAYSIVSENSNTNTENYIIKHTSREERVLFLGYYDALESIVKTGRILPVRNATSHYICLKDADLRRYFQIGFFEDMNKSRPIYVVDMEGVLDRPGLMPVKNYIQARYYLDTLIESNRFYKIKSLH